MNERVTRNAELRDFREPKTANDLCEDLGIGFIEVRIHHRRSDQSSAGIVKSSPRSLRVE